MLRGRRAERPPRILIVSDDRPFWKGLAQALIGAGYEVVVCVGGSPAGAAGRLITSGADIAAIGGFSGRESQVTAAWLADAVDDGQIRWVLVEESGGMPADGRTGSTEVMATVAAVCTPVDGVDGLYDCSGDTAELRAAGS